MNIFKRQATRLAKRIARAKFQHDAKVGTGEPSDSSGREYGCGPGFPKDRSRNGNTGKRRNPLPGPGNKAVTA